MAPNAAERKLSAAEASRAGWYKSKGSGLSRERYERQATDSDLSSDDDDDEKTPQQTPQAPTRVPRPDPRADASRKSLTGGIGGLLAVSGSCLVDRSAPAAKKPAPTPSSAVGSRNQLRSNSLGGYGRPEGSRTPAAEEEDARRTPARLDQRGDQSRRGSRDRKAPEPAPQRQTTGEETQPKRVSIDAEDLGAAWMVKLQADEETRNKKRECARNIMRRIEATVPTMSSGLDATSHVRLIDRIAGDVDTVLVTMSRQAKESVKQHLAEAQAVKIEAAEFESKLAQMNTTYLKEVTQLRDRHRVVNMAVIEHIESLTEDQYVKYYEPMQHLSMEHRHHVLALVEEKLKQIFSFDPSLRQQTDKNMLASFEDHILQEKVNNLEKQNAKLREEVMTVRTKLKKTEDGLTKNYFEMADLERKRKEVEDELRANVKAAQDQLQVTESRAKEMQQDMSSQIEELSKQKEVYEEKCRTMESKFQADLANAERRAIAAESQIIFTEDRCRALEDQLRKAAMLAADLESAEERVEEMKVMLLQMQQEKKLLEDERKGVDTEKQRADEELENLRKKLEKMSSRQEREAQRREAAAAAREALAKEAAAKEAAAREAAAAAAPARPGIGIVDLKLPTPAREAPEHPVQREPSKRTPAKVSPTLPPAADPGPQHAEAAMPSYRREDLDQISDLRQQLEKSNAEFVRMTHERDSALVASHKIKARFEKELETTSTSLKTAQEEVTRLTGELEKARQQASTAQTVTKAVRKELHQTRQQLAAAERRRLDQLHAKVTTSAEQLSAELKQKTKAYQELSEELIQTKSNLSMAQSRINVLELQIQALQSDKVSQCKASYEHKKLEFLVDQRETLMEKVTIQKAQLDEVVMENQVMALALREMQEEVQELTRQLREAVPDTSSMGKDVESVLGRMEGVVLDGGAAYLKLYKEAKLRDVAVMTLNTVRFGECRPATAPVDWGAIDANDNDSSTGEQQAPQEMQRPNTSPRAGATSQLARDRRGSSSRCNSQERPVSRPVRTATILPLGLGGLSPEPPDAIFEKSVTGLSSPQASVGPTSPPTSPRRRSSKEEGGKRFVIPPQTPQNGPLIGADLDSGLLTSVPQKVSNVVEGAAAIVNSHSGVVFCNNMNRLLVMKEGTHSKPLAPVRRASDLSAPNSPTSAFNTDRGGLIMNLGSKRDKFAA